MNLLLLMRHAGPPKHYAAYPVLTNKIPKYALPELFFDTRFRAVDSTSVGAYILDLANAGPDSDPSRRMPWSLSHESSYQLSSLTNVN